MTFNIQALVNNLSYKSALFLEQICEMLHRHPKKGEIQIIEYKYSVGRHISNGYFTVGYNAINGICTVVPTDSNIVLKNYLSSLGVSSIGIGNLEELEKFCETAKFIGGMGDEH